ncbi:MAG: CBS domain-containing protein [Hadesarchaea archaeon]|nr:MAG: CBS domain-containing protein [Hadesarchaea archaeon]TDA36570.1 MAG: CBS domain-containing protein [Hadesarchaea archaeon]
MMTGDVKYAEIPGTRAEAIELLKKLEVSAIPVVNSNTRQLVGMVTLRKLLEHPEEDQLAMLVDRDVPRVSPEDDLSVAARHILTTGNRRLPVVENGELVGVITVRDIVYRALANMNLERPASDFMQPSVAAVWEGTPLRAAVEIMSLARVRALPVINEMGDLVGIIDDSDIIKLAEVETTSKISQLAGKSEGDSWSWDSEARIYITKTELKLPPIPVKEVMVRDLIYITKKTSVSKCAQLMKEHRIEQTPVLSADNKFLGLVRDIDLLGALL